MKKLFTIKEVADVVQISKRTLHYYHDIELVIPNHIESNGYRLYDSANIRKLQSIIFLKELGLSLAQIELYFEADVQTKNNMLKASYNNVKQQRDKLTYILQFLDEHFENTPQQALKEENIGAFNMDQQYMKEAQLKYGNTKYYQSFDQQREGMNKKEREQNNQQTKAQFDAFFDEVNNLVLENKSIEDIARVIPKLETILTQQVPNCDKQFLIYVAETYNNDERFQRNLNKNRVENFHEYLVAAIKYYVKQQG